MKTIAYTQYGSPDVLRIEEVAIPTPTADQVLVKVMCASVNPLDWHIMRAEPFIARLSNGLQKPKNPRLGADLAGEVVGVGEAVTRFKIGDLVFGDVAPALGTLAEYVVSHEGKLVHKPNNITFQSAAAVPVAAITALQGLFHQPQELNGAHVLVNGASGGIGTFAVQIAKAYGAEVTAVCGTRNVGLVRSLGATHVFDYTQEDFTQSGKQYDLILDAVGNLTASAMNRALKPKGVATVVGFTTLGAMFRLVVQGGWISRRSDKRIGMIGTAQTNEKDLTTLKELLETGKITPVIDRQYPFAQTAEAIRYLEQGHANGKVIVNIG